MKSLGRISILWLLIVTLSYTVAAAPGDVKWTYESQDLYAVDFSISPDGTIYLSQVYFETYQVNPSPGVNRFIFSVTNRLVALNPAGQVKWRYDGVGMNSVVRKDGRILAVGIATQYNHAGTLTNIVNHIQGINPEGTSWLAYTNGVNCALTADDDAIVNINTDASGSVYPLTSPDYGLAKVKFSVPAQVWTNQILHPYGIPTIAPDGGVYISSREIPSVHTITSTGTVFNPFTGYFYAFDRQGKLRWQLTEANVNYIVSAIGSDGSVCLGKSTFQENPNLTSYQFLVMSADGQTKWTVSGSGKFSSAVIDAQNNIYVSSGNKLTCFDPAGGVRWQSSYSVYYSPALAADGKLYIVSGSTLYAINSANGSRLWSRDLGSAASFSPKIGDDGTIYLLTENRYLMAIQGSAPPADAPWPQERHDARRTNRANPLRPVNLSRNMDGKFFLTLLLEPDQTYKVEVSDDLETWVEIGSFTSSNSAQTFLDESSADKPQRFYRLAVP